MPAPEFPPSATPLWLWPNLLSLDAPLVAVLWLQMFSSRAGIDLGWNVSLILALTVWLIYTADRLLDVSRGKSTVEESSRHRFCRAHHRAFVVLLVVAMGIACWLSRTLDHRTLMCGALLMLLVAGYFLAIHRPGSQTRFPKEAVVGIVFGLGVYLPVWARLAPSAAMTVCVALFMLPCWLNAVLIEYSEWTNLRQRRGKGPHALTVAAGKQLSAIGAVIATFAGVLILLSGFRGERSILLSIALSGLTLAVLAALRQKLGLDALRVLADATLLTPGLVLLFRR